MWSALGWASGSACREPRQEGRCRPEHCPSEKRPSLFHDRHSMACRRDDVAIAPTIAWRSETDVHAARIEDGGRIKRRLHAPRDRGKRRHFPASRTATEQP